MADKPTVIINKQPQTDNLEKVETFIKEMKFGTITIHVEDGKIIQVDKLEKVRFK